jgi:hypothetical protein
MSRTALVLVLSVWAAVTVRAQADQPVETLGMPRSVSGDVVYQGAPAVECHGSSKGRVRGCLSHLKDWLCYRSTRGHCKCEPVPCCRPKLHAFFLHRCQGGCDHYDGEVIPVYFSYTDLLHDNVAIGGCCGTSCHGCR